MCPMCVSFCYYICVSLNCTFEHSIVIFMDCVQEMKVCRHNITNVCVCVFRHICVSAHPDSNSHTLYSSPHKGLLIISLMHIRAIEFPCSLFMPVFCVPCCSIVWFLSSSDSVFSVCPFPFFSFFPFFVVVSGKLNCHPSPIHHSGRQEAVRNHITLPPSPLSTTHQSELMSQSLPATAMPAWQKKGTWMNG